MRIFLVKVRVRVSVVRPLVSKSEPALCKKKGGKAKTGKKEKGKKGKREKEKKGKR